MKKTYLDGTVVEGTPEEINVYDSLKAAPACAPYVPLTHPVNPYPVCPYPTISPYPWYTTPTWITTGGVTTGTAPIKFTVSDYTDCAINPS